MRNFEYNVLESKRIKGHCRLPLKLALLNKLPKATSKKLWLFPVCKRNENWHFYPIIHEKKFVIVDEIVGAISSQQGLSSRILCYKKDRVSNFIEIISIPAYHFHISYFWLSSGALPVRGMSANHDDFAASSPEPYQNTALLFIQYQ